MKYLDKAAAIGGLLAFNGGYVDAAGFLGLHGLFAAHITGNLATLCAAIVLGSKGYLGKMLALPEFVAVIALARVAGAGLRARNYPARDVLLATEFMLLPCSLRWRKASGRLRTTTARPRSPPRFAAIAAMAVQNDVQRVYLPAPAADHLHDRQRHATPPSGRSASSSATGREPATTRAAVGRMAINLAAFAVGCALAALLYWAVGFWCLALPLGVSCWPLRR